MGMRVERDEDHILVASVYEEGGETVLELEFEHPCSCKVWHGCSGGNYLGCPDYTPHAHVEHTCGIAYYVEGIGADESVFGYSWWELMDMPLNHLNDVATALGEQLLVSDEARVPITFEWSGGYDYWGEYDSDLTVWAR